MMKGIVRMGDKTTHGGTVLEGDPFFDVYGKPAAMVGHMVLCPKCKGAFPIIEGDASFEVNGKAVALHGMRTACGAALIASISGIASVEHPTGGTAFANDRGGATVVPSSWGPDSGYDDRYVLQDSMTGQPLPDTEYAIVRPGRDPEYGRTDSRGRTHLLSSETRSTDVQIFVEG